MHGMHACAVRESRCVESKWTSAVAIRHSGLVARHSAINELAMRDDWRESRPPAQRGWRHRGGLASLDSKLTRMTIVLTSILNFLSHNGDNCRISQPNFRNVIVNRQTLFCYSLNAMTNVFALSLAFSRRICNHSSDKISFSYTCTYVESRLASRQ